MRTRRLVALLVIGGLVVAACGGSARRAAPRASVLPTSAPTASVATTISVPPTTSTGPTTTTRRPGSTATTVAAPPTARVSVEVTVPDGDGIAGVGTPRALSVPVGWTAEVWARVPDARMEVWTPEGDLLVSQPDDGRIAELTPGAAGAPPASHTLLSGLTSPQGLAFARLSGRWTLFVGESDQIDRYPWGAAGITGARSVIASGLPDLDPAGDDVHREKDVAIAANGTVYFDVGSSSNANPDDRTASPPRGVIMAMKADGSDLRVVEKGVRNGEGLAVAPDGSVWTAVNNRDNVPYPFHSFFDGQGDAFGQVIQAYVNEHPPDEVVPVTIGRDLGWPYCNPDQDESRPAGSLRDVPLVADSVTNPGGADLDCGRLPPINVGLPAHSAPLGLTFLNTSTVPVPWSDGAVVAVHGSWNREPPRAPAVLWMGWDGATHSLEPAVTLIGGFQNADGSRTGRPVDAVAGPDGALYVSDDTAGAIYRLAPPA